MKYLKSREPLAIRGINSIMTTRHRASIPSMKAMGRKLFFLPLPAPEPAEVLFPASGPRPELLPGKPPGPAPLPPSAEKFGLLPGPAPELPPGPRPVLPGIPPGRLPGTSCHRPFGAGSWGLAFSGFKAGSRPGFRWGTLMLSPGKVPG